MKKLLTLVICVSLALAMAVPAFASCGGNNVQLPKYITELTAISYRISVSYTDAAYAANLKGSQYIVGGEAASKNDLNKGCGGGSLYLYLVKSAMSDNASEAIRDLIAVYKPSGTAPDATVTVNGIVYYPVKGVRVEGRSAGNLTTSWKDAFNFNDGYELQGAECTTDVYLYYTKDAKAGDPITTLNIYMDSDNRNQPNLVRELSTNDSCNFNEGYKNGKAAYIQIVRDSGNSGSTFNNSTSVIFVIVGVVAIIAAGTVVICTKKKKPTADAE